jgi:hypothetical protein
VAGGKQIYVEIQIHGPIDQVWHLTQTPELHERWDLRFSHIRYLPRLDPLQPQRFLYTTRIGMGLKISGEGESVGTHDGANGERSSALRFWSDDPKSLISDGSGFWKYIPNGTCGSLCFLTGYDYRVRFGALGRAFDRLFFRPLLGWATAWSFDRLRLWIEKGIDPALSMRLSAINTGARLALAIVCLYQGAVPKLIFRHAQEVAMLTSAGVSDIAAQRFCIGIGWAEIALGIVLLLFWRWRWPLWFIVISMPMALLAVGLTSPNVLTGPFGPFPLNVSVFALALVALLTGHDLPSASRCLRRPGREAR